MQQKSFRIYYAVTEEYSKNISIFMAQTDECNAAKIFAYLLPINLSVVQQKYLFIAQTDIM